MIGDESVPSLQDTAIVLTGLLYYIYRGAGCPFGDTEQGYHLWLAMNIRQPLEDAAKRWRGVGEDD